MKRTTSRDELRKTMQTYAALAGDCVADGISLAELVATRTTLRRAAEKAEAIRATCHNCMHFALEHCKHHNAPVPVEFQRQVEQCSDWRYDGIPF